MSMDLYSVKACVTRNACCIFEGLLEFFDLLNGHCASQNVGSEEGGLLAGRDELIAELIGIAVAAGARSHLETDLCTPAVNSLDKVGVCRDGDIAVKGAFVRALGDLLGKRSAAGDYHADAASCTLFKVVDLPVGLRAVRKGCVMPHRGKDETVFDLHLADFERCKERAVVFLFHCDVNSFTC